MAVPECSVVIRTFNEAKHLGSLFDEIERQTYDDHEVIVVDSGSYDGTLETALSRTDHVHQINSRDFTFGYSLNVGIRAARGRFVAIVSAHTLPVEETWLERLVAPLRSDATAMVYGRQLGVPESKFSERLDFGRTFGAEPLTIQSTKAYANNANSAIRKDLWCEHEFDEALAGLEDIEWSRHWMERGYNVVYRPEAAIYHIHEETWRQVRHRYYREAVAAQRIGIRSKVDVPRELVREAWRFFGDIFHLASERALDCGQGVMETLPEIARFRYNKAVGTAVGLLDGASATDLERREPMYFDKTCSAVVIRSPGHAELRETEVPEVKPGDVLLKVAYEGVCATDLEILDGNLGYYEDGLADYPIIPGHELSATVARVGVNVNDFQGGERVVAECIQPCGKCSACEREIWMGCEARTEMGVMRKNGGYAEYVLVPAEFVHEIPASLTLEQACLVEPLAVVLKGLERLGSSIPELGEGVTVAVVGAGPLGQLCVQALRSRGCQVIAFDRNPTRRQNLEEIGVRTEESVDPKALRKCHVVVEATGDADALDAILRDAPAGASILLLGLPYARRHFNFESIVAYDRAIIGSVGSAGRHFELAINLLAELELGPFLQKVMPLEDFEEAWRICRAGEQLKVILEVGNAR